MQTEERLTIYRSLVPRCRPSSLSRALRRRLSFRCRFRLLRSHSYFLSDCLLFGRRRAVALSILLFLQTLFLQLSLFAAANSPIETGQLLLFTRLQAGDRVSRVRRDLGSSQYLNSNFYRRRPVQKTAPQKNE